MAWTSSPPTRRSNAFACASPVSALSPGTPVYRFQRIRFAGGHILQVYRRQYQHRVGRMLVELGVVPEQTYARAKLR